MPIIFQLGENFWIEQHDIAITIDDAAGIATSAIVNLDRPGTHLHSSAIVIGGADNDNSQAIGYVRMLAQSGNMAYGLSITGFRIRVGKVAGTAGSTAITYSVITFMRKDS